jgi:hypothetical protein
MKRSPARPSCTLPGHAVPGRLLVRSTRRLPFWRTPENQQYRRCDGLKSTVNIHDSEAGEDKEARVHKSMPAWKRGALSVMQNRLRVQAFWACASSRCR